MYTQRGFVGVGVLIAIILGLVVLGGGAYFVMQQNSPSQTASENNLDNAQTLPITNSQTQKTQTSNSAPTQNTPTANSQVQQPVSDANDKLFVAVQNSGRLNLYIFNTASGQFDISKEISLDDGLNPSAGGIQGSDSVQYNPKTQEVFFSTSGRDSFAGSCSNKDGTCVSRIYKIGLNESKPKIVFSSDELPAHWIVNNFDNSILLSFLNQKTQTLKKIGAKDGNLIFTRDNQIKDYTELADLVVSKDGRYTYQASKESTNGKWFYEILRLRIINNTNGNITEQELFSGESIVYKTSLSPDDNYLAFYSGVKEPTKLYIYNILEKKLINTPYQCQSCNYTLLWSGDSKKLLIVSQSGNLLPDTFSYYDVNSSKIVPIDVVPEQTARVRAWAPSAKYFASAPQPQYGGVKIVDVGGNKIIDTKIIGGLGIAGMHWY